MRNVREEDDKFWFCSVDVSLKDGKILVEMEDYADSRGRSQKSQEDGNFG